MKMKGFIFSLILFHLINFSFSLVPIWNINNSSKVLNVQSSITLHSKDNNPKILLTKRFSKDEDDNIIDKNYISINGDTEINVKWEDIESSYEIDKWGTIICPQGRYFLNRYTGNGFKELAPKTFDTDNNLSKNDNWELLCYPIKDRSFMFQGFINQQNINYIYGCPYRSDETDWRFEHISDFFLDFMLTDKLRYNQKYYMFALIVKDSQLFLQLIHTEIDGICNIYCIGGDSILLGYKSENTHGYFDHTKNVFYWISANNSNTFNSGYLANGITIDLDKETAHYKKEENNISPLQFLQNVTINKLEMIRNTRFAYYEILSKDDNTKYYGIIDILMNKVIFNTNEALKTFKPIKNIAMLAITNDNKIYQICLIKYDEECVESCPEGTILILDTENGNYCGNENEQKCKDNILLIPDQVCISTCNTSIYDYSEKDGVKKCGLCKDIDPSKPYKILNDSECLNEKPNGTFYLSKEFQILERCGDYCDVCENAEKCLTCKDGYKEVEGKCEKDHPESLCPDYCECIENSQKCYKCKYDKYLINDTNNCTDGCSEGFYEPEDNEFKLCFKCHKNCKACHKGEDGDNQNCDSCRDNLLLLNSSNSPQNCVEKCPKNFTQNGSYCISNNGTEPDKKDDDKPDYMLWIFIIIFAILLLLISLCICKRHFSRNKKDIEFINDINTELQENNRIIE